MTVNLPLVPTSIMNDIGDMHQECINDNSKTVIIDTFAIPFEISTVAEDPGPITMLIFGTPGSGKTVLAGCAEHVPQMAPVLFIDVDAGRSTLNGIAPSVHFIKLRNWGTLYDVVDFLESPQGSIFKTIVMDNLTELTELCLADIVKDTVDGMPTIKHWNELNTRIRNMIRTFRSLGRNLILIAWEDYKKDEVGDRSIAPSLRGKLTTQIPGMVSISGRLFVKGGERKFVTINDDVSGPVNKSRYTDLPGEIKLEDIHSEGGIYNFARIYAHIRNLIPKYYNGTNKDVMKIINENMKENVNGSNNP